MKRDQRLALNGSLILADQVVGLVEKHCTIIIQ